jgi:hypothetical protein
VQHPQHLKQLHLAQGLCSVLLHMLHGAIFWPFAQASSSSQALPLVI